MTREIDEARRLLNRRLQQAGAGTLYGVVQSVDEKARTCDVQVGGVVYEGVLLYAIENQELTGFVMIPSKDSGVLVGRIDGGNRLHVVMFSQVDKVIFTAGEKVRFSCDATNAVYTNDKISMRAEGNKIEVSADNIIINGGDLGGLVNIEPLTQKVNDLITAFNGHTHTIPTGGVAVAGTPAAQNNPAPIQVPAPIAQHPEVKRGDYEDTNVKH